MNYAVSIDVGGTFSDAFLINLQTGQNWCAKSPTTPSEPIVGFMNAITKVLGMAGVDPGDLRHVFHATTLITNALLEHKGASIGLVTNRGFRHILEIGRHDAPRTANIYSWIKPQRPVEPFMIREISGRLRADGTEREPLSETDVRAAARFFREQKVESVAVALLHSYRNPDHEHQVLEWLADELPDTYLCASADILPVFREYERSMATVINAYSIPRAYKYFESLKQSLTEAGIVDSVFIMKSNGGVCSVEAAKEQPVYLALSGPAGGVIGAKRYGEEAGTGNLITIDIGGTSADISLIADGRLETTVEGEIAEFPLSVPMVDVHTIGSGGGSIARVTETGSLTVGPESAGAEPGPVCYGRGGTEPTVTDAHLALGRITDQLLGGEMKLDVEAARSAIIEKIAKPLNLSMEEAAEGILTIMNNDMMGMLRLVSVEKGHDPKKFSLMPFGGAGSLHGVELAQLTQIPQVIIPPGSGVLSAFGLLQTDVKQEFSQIVNMTGPDWNTNNIVEAYERLTASAKAWLEAESIAPEAMEFIRSADIRYAEQGFELTVEYEQDTVDRQAIVHDLAEAFHRKHEQLYTYSLRENGIEIVTLRVTAVGKLPRFPVSGFAEDEAQDPYLHSAHVHFQKSGGWIDTPFYQRERMRPGYELTGPAIILQSDSTLVLPPETHGRVDGAGNFIVRINDQLS